MPPLAPIALAFAGGVVLGGGIGCPPTPIATLLAVTLLGWVLARPRTNGVRRWWTLAVAVLCGALRIAFALETPGPGSITARTGSRDAVDVVARLRTIDRDERGALLVLDGERADGRPVRGAVRLRVIEGVPGALPGDRVAFRARLVAPRGYRNPGVPDSTLADRARDLRAVASVENAAAVRVLVPGSWGIRRAAEGWRRALGRRLDEHTHGDARVLLGALVLGERARVSDEVEAWFRRSGITHLLSVSGVHMAAITLLAFVGIRRLLARLPGVPIALPVRAVAAAVALPCCAAYALVAGAALPVVRSAVVATVMLGGAWFDRHPDARSALAVAALLLLALDPGGLFSPSFQLSFGACVGLVLAPRASGAGLTRAVAGMARSTFAASLMTAGTCAYHFGEIAVAGLVTNLIAIPFSTFVLLPVALLGLLVPALLPTVEGLADMLIEIARLGASLPGASVRVPTPTLVELALWTAVAVLALRRRWLLGLAVAVTLAVVVVCRMRAARIDDGARVTVLDVGQGDAILVELPGWTLLCDGGGSFDGSPDVGDLAVLPALRGRGILRLDAAVLTHPHPDHFGGLRAVIRELDVRELWTNGEPCRHAACPDLFERVASRGVRVMRPHAVERRGARIDPLYPLPAYDPAIRTNDNSVVLRVSAHGRSVLLAGDLEGEGEILLAAAAGRAARADALKVPHHGSRTSSTDELLDAVRPRLAVVSAGAANRFGFPHAEVLDRFASRGIRVLRTDRHGAVTLTLSAVLGVTSVDP